MRRQVNRKYERKNPNIWNSTLKKQLNNKGIVQKVTVTIKSIGSIGEHKFGG